MSKFCIYMHLFKHMWDCEKMAIVYFSNKSYKMITNKLILMLITQKTLKHNEINTTKPNYLKTFLTLSIPVLCSLYQWKQITFLYSDNFIQTKMAIIVNGFAIWWYYRKISRNGPGRELELRGDLYRTLCFIKRQNSVW